MRARRLRGAFAVGSLLGLVGVSPTIAASPPPCEAAGFSPAFGIDQTVFCAYVARGTSDFVLTQSTDRGRTWRERTRLTAPRSGQVAVTGVLFSPGYDLDRTIYVTTSQGLLVWHDAAGKASLSETPSIGTHRAVAFPDVSLPAASRHSVAFVDGEELFARVYDSLSATTRYVPGAGSGTREIIVPTDFATRRQAVAIAVDSPVQTDDAFDLNAYRCTGDLVCEELSHSFGHVLDDSFGRLPDQTLFLGTHDWKQLRSRVWRSNDGGVTWSEWHSLNALLAPIDKANRGPTTVFVSSSPDAPKRLFARFVTHGDRSPYPSQQLFRSDDGGAGWRRVGYALDRTQPGKNRGNLPFGAAPHPEQNAVAYHGHISAQPGGRLYAVGVFAAAGKHQSGLFCSPDLGTRWYRSC